MFNSKSIQTRVILMIGLSLTLTLISSLVVWPVSQVQAGATLPPRSTSSPTTGTGAGNDQSDSNDDDDDSSPMGAYIELQAGVTRGGDWSQVEWQDSNGAWQPVEGWAGSLDSQGSRRWWVAAKDFGTGPFRWVVKEVATGSVLLTSDGFNLPSEANQTVVITQ